MDFKMLAEQILEALGGEENVKTMEHCTSRLRFTLYDESKANDEVVKGLKGVLGLVKKGGQYQVVIGNNVSKVYLAVKSIANFDSSGKAVKKTNPEQKEKKVSWVSKLIGIIANCITPAVPAIAGAGMIKVLLTLLPMIGVLSTDSQTYTLLSVIADASFYFLPLIVAWNSAKVFGTSPVLALIVMSVLLHPDFITLLSGEETVKFLGITVTKATYSSTVVPPILIVYVMSWIEKLLDKVIPASMKMIFQPMLILLITAPLGFLIVGPLGTVLSSGLASIVNFLQSNNVGWIATVIFAAFFPLIVSTGLHTASIPLVVTAFATVGYETIILVGALASNMAVAGASLAVMVKTKDKELKQIALSGSITDILGGVTEPLLYGVCLPLKKPLIGAIIGGFAGGIYAAITKLKCWVWTNQCMTGLPSYISSENSRNVVNAIIVFALSIVTAFIATWILMGKKEKQSE